MSPTNYEMQVYGAETVAPETLMIELHSKYRNGVGIGATAATDHLIFKAILGRRFDWGRHSPVD